jgi:hypothetical protein
MKAISSATAAVIIATIFITFVGSFFLSRIIEESARLERLGFDIEWGESVCTLDDSICSCASPSRCRADSDCDPTSGSDTCTASCPPRDHTVVVNNCIVTYSHDCVCDARPPKCSGSFCTCSVDGTCNYTCESGWYNDDGNDNNGCENAPPRYLNPIGSSLSNPLPEDMVYHWVNWADVNGASLQTATLEVNGSGVNCDETANVSFYYFSVSTEIANISWQVGSNCGGKVIGWRQYANDSAGRWNVTDFQTYSVISRNTSFNIETFSSVCGLINYTALEIEPGVVTTEIEFNFTTLTETNKQPCVSGTACCQNIIFPIWRFYNTGNVDEIWEIKINETIPGITITFSNSTPPSVDEHSFLQTEWNLIGKISPGQSLACWLYADIGDGNIGGSHPRFFTHRSRPA